MAINFIFDEELETNRKELQSILDFMNEDQQLKKKADVLTTFVWAAVRSLVKPPVFTLEELKKPEIKESPVTLLNKWFGKKDVRPIIKKLPAPIPKPEVKKEESKPEVIQKNLILDKITEKVLAYVKVTDKYFLIEPQINEDDTKVLAKILKKKPKNMDKGWKLISKYGKKFNVPTDHFTNIKYYVVNFLFGLGRIEPLVYDKAITEIICEGANKPLKVKYNDKLFETNIIFAKKDDLDNFIYNIAYRVKQKINKRQQKASFSYREMGFECIIGFDNSDSKFIIKKNPSKL
jgi:hypothetical protein